MESTNQLLKKAVFLNENDRIGLFIFILFEHKSCPSYQIGPKKNVYNDFFGIFKFVLAFLKPNCHQVVLFVVAEVFHKWKNANEKIFSDLVVKNSICGFHGYVTAKLKCWLSFKNLNEQMVSDTQKIYFSSSSNIYSWSRESWYSV